MAPKKSTTGKYPGPGYDEAAEAKRVEKFMKTQESRKYSPAPMSAAAKAKAGAAGKAAKKASDARMAAKNAGKFNKAITPPAKRNVGSGGKAFTPAQIAELKKMMRGAGRLDK
jgi:hypothetical protein